MWEFYHIHFLLTAILEATWIVHKVKKQQLQFFHRTKDLSDR